MVENDKLRVSIIKSFELPDADWHRNYEDASILYKCHVSQLNQMYPSLEGGMESIKNESVLNNMKKHNQSTENFCLK